MSRFSGYAPPKVWNWDSASGGRFSNINRPFAGPIHDSILPIGDHHLQLYSLGTPNGVKVTILLEEMLAQGFQDAEYDAHLIDFFNGDQFGSGFVKVNPNSKIPALMDYSDPSPVRVFESCAILLYLCEKFNAFLPTEALERAECLSWVFWQASSAPFLGGGFGHFYQYAPIKIEYAINRYSLEIKRQFDVLDKRLSDNPYLGGSNYSIADMAVWPWYGAMFFENFYSAIDFLDIESYAHLRRWAYELGERDAVIRGRKVNRTWGLASDQVPTRNSDADFHTLKRD